jgi:hypothetical protein
MSEDTTSTDQPPAPMPTVERKMDNLPDGIVARYTVLLDGAIAGSVDIQTDGELIPHIARGYARMEGKVVTAAARQYAADLVANTAAPPGTQATRTPAPPSQVNRGRCRLTDSRFSRINSSLPQCQPLPAGCPAPIPAHHGDKAPNIIAWHRQHAPDSFLPGGRYFGRVKE